MAFKHKNKKRAFSLVELMMLLLVSSLIIAALVPVVTKKHFRLPSVVVHGAVNYTKQNGPERINKMLFTTDRQTSVYFHRLKRLHTSRYPQSAAVAAVVTQATQEVILLADGVVLKNYLRLTLLQQRHLLLPGIWKTKIYHLENFWKMQGFYGFMLKEVTLEVAE